MDRDQIAAASRTISGHWRAGTKLAALEASQRPHARKDGYAIQAELEARRARIRAAQDDLPRRRGLVHEATQALAQAQAAEAAAKEDSIARKIREETGEVERGNALRRYRERKADEKKNARK